jgi:predicted DNA binding protein
LVTNCDRPYQETVAATLADHPVSVGFLFDSHARGEAHNRSDVDVVDLQSASPELIRAVFRDGERLLKSLTDKQRRALEVAYFSGYFERPRNHDTTDVATKLDISRQTLTQHLRAGERKLFAALFDDSDP